METIPCPGCTTALEPSATVCPTCLRPRGKLEITRAYATLRLVEKERRQRPFVIAGYLLAVGAACGLMYRYRLPIAAAVSAVRARVSSFADAAMDPKNLLPPSAEAPAAATPEAPALTPPSAAPFARFAPAPATPTPPAPPVAAKPPEPAISAKRTARVADLPIPPLGQNQWAVYGRIYDLVTLRPVAGVKLTFTIPGNPVGSMGYASSDEHGRYVLGLVRLPKGSYEIHSSKEGYSSVALYEADIPYAQLSAGERRDIVHNAQDGDMPLPPLTDINGEQSMHRDVFLAPQR
jgi:hypothetical protein